MDPEASEVICSIYTHPDASYYHLSDDLGGQLCHSDDRYDNISVMYNEFADIPMPPTEVTPWRITAKVPAEKRDKIVSYLRKEGVGARAYFKPLHTHTTQSPKGFPNAVKFSSERICLPSYPALEDLEIEYICKTLRDVLNDV